MEDIKEFHVVPLTQSNYLVPKSVYFTQDGKKRRWDFVTEHSDVNVLLFNTSRNVFILVKQFRPAVYLYNVKSAGSGVKVNTEVFPGSLGVTVELCSGLVDKENKSLEEVAQAEVLEECGYSISVDDLQKITKCRNSIGLVGSETTVYYAEVTDEQKVSGGGGLAEEGELIEVIEVTVDEARKLIYDEAVNRESGLLVALLWFFNKVWPHKCGQEH
ncbi:uridine diphosphate glucose pyrophosphatase isoform X1 [Biomphalaria glabrata]|nr:uridine diphosphate glucose pyrophosphatase isoform X1 [Biomphalaria glabrata]